MDRTAAEAWLSQLGVPSDLKELPVRYGHFATVEKEVRGAESYFSKDAPWMDDKPKVKWTFNHNPDKKYALMAVDPDTPEPASDGDGTKVGEFGPWMNWFVLNCKDTAASGHVVYPYEAPNPTTDKAHRVVFILFEQLRPGKLQGFIGVDRMNWDFEGFLRENKEALKPVAMNFLYVTGTPHSDDAAGSIPTDYDEHDEL